MLGGWVSEQFRLMVIRPLGFFPAFQLLSILHGWLWRAARVFVSRLLAFAWSPLLISGEIMEKFSPEMSFPNSAYHLISRDAQILPADMSSLFFGGEKRKLPADVR